jgi:UDP-N-acetylmuramate--alanine ligase
MKYYFVGIKGTGMSALALIIKDLGNEVVGADINKPLFTEKELLNNDIVIESLDDMHYQDCDIIVVGNTFVDKFTFDNKEVMTYQELLSYIADKYYSIAVCGTHGKTTITNMIKHVLSDIDNVSYLVGDGTGKAYKDSKYFVFEACEHRDHFLSYFPDMIVCDNVDYDHVEYFKTKRQYIQSKIKMEVCCW